MTVTCCPLSGGDWDSAYCLQQRTVTARKEHACEECCEPIRPGIRYELYTSVCDGSLYTAKTCLSCVEIRNHFACGGWVFGRLWEDLEWLEARGRP